MAGFQVNTNKWYLYKSPNYLMSGRITFVPNAGKEVYQFYADFYIEVVSSRYVIHFKNVTMDGPAGQTVPTAITNYGTKGFFLAWGDATSPTAGSGMASITIPAGATRGDVIATDWVSNGISRGQSSMTYALKLMYHPTSTDGALKSIFGSSDFSSPLFYRVLPIKVNNNQIDTIYVNGTKVDKLYVNGKNSSHQYYENTIPNQ